MPTMYCPNCRAVISSNSSFCPKCGAKLNAQMGQDQVVQEYPPIQNQNPYPPQPVVYMQGQFYTGPSLPRKSKTTAGVLYLLLGDIGVGNFYMGKTGLGILDIVFCWTGVPAIVGFIRGLIILCSSKENFEQSYNCIAAEE